MAKKKKFNEAGAVAEKTVWNKAKTRKWQMTYKLVEVKPKASKANRPDEVAKKQKLKKVIKKTKIKGKSSAKRKTQSTKKS